MANKVFKIFISYSRKDKNIVFGLKNEIEMQLGSGACWIDLTGIESDRQFVDVIIDAIDNADVFLFMYSANSEESEWTRKEVEYAYNEKKRIVFVLIDNTPLSKYYRFMFRGHDIINLTDKDERSKLLKNLSAWSKRDSASESMFERKYTTTKSETENKFQWNKVTDAEIGLLLIIILFPYIGIPWGFFYVVKNKEKFPQLYSLYRSYALKIEKFCHSAFDTIKNNRRLIYAVITLVCLYLLGLTCFIVYDNYKHKIRMDQEQQMTSLDSSNTIDSLTNGSDEMASLDTSNTIDSLTNELDKVALNKHKNDSIREKETLNTYSLETEASFGNKPAYFHVTFNCSFSTSISMNIRTEKNFYTKMWLNKKHLEGAVEDENGKSIGFVDATLNVTGTSFEIYGKLIFESDNYSYQERRLQVKGQLPQDVANKLQAEKSKNIF